MTPAPPRDLWAVVCADGRVHYGQRPAGIYRGTAYIDDAPIDDGDDSDDDALSDESVDCAGGPHRVVRYVAARSEPTAEDAAAAAWADLRACAKRAAERGSGALFPVRPGKMPRGKRAWRGGPLIHRPTSGGRFYYLSAGDVLALGETPPPGFVALFDFSLTAPKEPR